MLMLAMVVQLAVNAVPEPEEEFDEASARCAWVAGYFAEGPPNEALSSLVADPHSRSPWYAAVRQLLNDQILKRLLRNDVSAAERWTLEHLQLPDAERAPVLLTSLDFREGPRVTMPVAVWFLAGRLAASHFHESLDEALPVITAVILPGQARSQCALDVPELMLKLQRHVAAGKDTPRMRRALLRFGDELPAIAATHEWIERKRAAGNTSTELINAIIFADTIGLFDFADYLDGYDPVAALATFETGKKLMAQVSGHRQPSWSAVYHSGAWSTHAVDARIARLKQRLHTQ